MNDRNRLIRLASTLPVGSPQRRAILAGIAAPDTVRSKRAGVLEDSVLSALRGGGVTGTPGIKSFQVTDAGIVALIEAKVLLPATPSTTDAVLQALPPAQVGTTISAFPSLLEGLSPAAAATIPFASLSESAFKKVVQSVVGAGLSKYSDAVLRALLEGRKGEQEVDNIQGILAPALENGAQLAPHVKTMVSGAKPQINSLEYAHTKFTVKGGALSFAMEVWVMWENRATGFSSTAHMEAAHYVDLSKKVYPTEASVRAALPAGLEERDIEDKGDSWGCFPAEVPKGLRGITYLEAYIADALVGTTPLVSLPRTVLEQLVRIVAEA